MKRIVIAATIIAAGLIGGMIGYYRTSHEGAEPLVEALFDGGGVHVRRVNMIPGKEEYVYSPVARIDSRGVSNTPDTSVSGSKPLDAGTPGGATIHTESTTETILIEQMYANREHLTPKDLVVAVRLRPTTTRELTRDADEDWMSLPWSWGNPRLFIDWQEHMFEGSEGWCYSQHNLSIPPKAHQLYFDGPSISECKWKGNELVFLKLGTENVKGRRLTNIDIVLIRKEAK